MCTSFTDDEATIISDWATIKQTTWNECKNYYLVLRKDGGMYTYGYFTFYFFQLNSTFQTHLCFSIIFYFFPKKFMINKNDFQFASI